MASEIEVLEDTTGENSTALDSAAELDSDGEESRGEDVYTAAAYGDMEKLRRLVEDEERPVTDPDGHGYYALQWAALNNRIAVADYILQHGAQVNVIDRTGQTALHWSAVRGFIQVAELLLRAGATLDAPDLFGYQVIHVAAQYGQTSFIYYIVAKWNADPDPLDHSGRSPLHWAAYKGFADSVRLLLCFDPYMMQQDNQGCTPLHWAALRGNIEACIVLVEAGRKDDLMVKDKSSLTPTGLAQDKGHWIITRYLDFAREVNDRDCGGHTKFRKLSKFWRSLLVWWIAIGLLATYIHSVISVHMAVLFGLFTWSGVFLATAGLVLFFKCSRKDPGYIKMDKRDTENRSDHLLPKMEYDLLSVIDWSQLCVPCKIIRPVCSQHCSTCNHCVEKHDHHSTWVSNCIGKKNKREFVMFITLEVLAMIITGSAAIIKIVSDPASPASFGAWLSHSAAHHSGMVLFFIMDLFLFFTVAVKVVVPASQQTLQIARNVNALIGTKKKWRNFRGLESYKKFSFVALWNRGLRFSKSNGISMEWLNALIFWRKFNKRKSTYQRAPRNRLRKPFYYKVCQNFSHLLKRYSEGDKRYQQTSNTDEEMGMLQMTGV